MTRVLVATSQRQGERASDFCWTVEGELAIFPFECDADQDDRGGGIDGGCGCRRSLVGAASSKATTTVRVDEMDLTRDQYVGALSESLRRSGWFDTIEDPEDVIREMAAELLDVAAEFEPGTVLERRGDEFQSR